MITHIADNAIRRIPTALLHIALIGCLGLACNKNEPTAAKSQQQEAEPAESNRPATESSVEVKLSDDALLRYGIKTEPASKHVLIPTLTAPARVSFNAEAIAHVGSPLNGRVTDIRARVGDTVKLGDVLLVIESPDLGEAQSEYLLKLAAAGAAVPAVDLAKSAYERAKALYDKSQGISLTEVQKREGDYRAAEAARLSAQTAVTGAENRLHLLGMNQAAVDSLAGTGEVDPHYSIKAPLAGQLIEREVTLGELVRPETDALLVIADTSTLWVLANVPEARLADIALHSAARVTLGTGDAATCTGTVAFVSAAVDPSTRSAQIRIEVQDGHLAMRPGMFAQVEIDTTNVGKTPEPVLAVPDEAVQTVDGSPAVFVPLTNAKNTFAKRTVRIGEAVGGMIPVLSGLKEGEAVVIAGSFLMKAELGKGTAEED